MKTRGPGDLTLSGMPSSSAGGSVGSLPAQLRAWEILNSQTGFGVVNAIKSRSLPINQR